MRPWEWLLLSLAWVVTWMPWALRLPFRYPWIIQGGEMRTILSGIGCALWIMLVPLGTVWLIQPPG